MKPSKILLLRAEIESDLADLEKVVSEIARLKMDIGSEEPSYRDKAAIGALLHSFYNGIESILKRLKRTAAEIDESVPVGDGWHRALLKCMEKDVAGVRPAVLDHETVSVLGP